MTAGCTCRIDAPGTSYEMRVLDRDCPVHGDRDPERRVLRVVQPPDDTER